MSDPARRNHERQSVRTSATVIAHSPDSQASFRTWTDDISPGGAKLLSRDQLPDNEIFLRVLIAGLQDKIIAGTIVHESYDEDRRLFSYGVRFTRVCDPEESILVMERI